MSEEQAREFKWTKKDGTRVKTVQFSIEKATEGGLGLYAITLLQEHGVPARRFAGGSPYMGHVAIEVPLRYQSKAERLVL